ncbi:MAG TPA: hypothetical protein VNA88_11560 [Candidatus Kapabacteria bacterium]|jgi:hypothetical protein|nr:hypothetical protein [Candidatus Kapabacteria bacterium]
MSQQITTIDDQSGTSSWPSLRDTRRPVAGSLGPSGPTWLPRALSVRGLVAALGLVALILFFRKPEALLLPQLIADDAVLFRDAWTHGLGVLFEPYAGYTLVVGRLVAWLGVVSAPVAAIPAFYAIAALASMLFVCGRLMSPRVTIPHGWVAALVVPLVPHDGEVYLNLCYIQWSLVLAAFPLLAIEAPTRAREWVGDLSTLALIGLSGPFILPIAPFFVIAALRDRRSRHRLALAAVASITALVQIGSLLGTGTLTQREAAASIVSDGLAAVGTKLLAVTFLGRNIPYDLPAGATAVLGIVLGLLLVAALAGITRRGRRMLLATLLAAVAFYALSGVVRVKEDPFNLVPFGHGDRYFFVPRVLLIWMLLLALAGRWRRIAAGLLVLVVLSAATTFRTDRPRWYDWSLWSGAIERGETTSIRVAPYDWTVEIPGRAR